MAEAYPGNGKDFLSCLVERPAAEAYIKDENNK
jgi:hypothetical protein